VYYTTRFSSKRNVLDRVSAQKALWLIVRPEETLKGERRPERNLRRLHPLVSFALFCYSFLTNLEKHGGNAGEMNDPIVKIEIVEYDPCWPALYAEERARVEVVLGGLVESIEHIGSTSVPGLSAKPIIDLLVTVARLGPVYPYIERLESLGYAYFPVLGNADRYAFGMGIPHTHHLHIVEQGSEAHLRPLAFRNYLRIHPEAARQYEALKRVLATRFQHDRAAYNQAKTDFILSIEAKARMV
jgi:GrpB-like predicted nucleotidyltransferase (UPF0157 family)